MIANRPTLSGRGLTDRNFKVTCPECGTTQTLDGARMETSGEVREYKCRTGDGRLLFSVRYALRGFSFYMVAGTEIDIPPPGGHK
jgi:hypothetical protein